MSGYNSREISFSEGKITLMEAGEGEPLLLLHAAGMSDAWLPAYQKLAERFHVIVPHHPGFGASDELKSVEGIDDLAFHYDALLSRLSYDTAYVLGVSFGGWIAAELAVLSPRRIKRLVLVDAIGLRIPEAPIFDTFGLNSEKLGSYLFHDPKIPEALFPKEPDIEFMMKAYRDEAAFARFAWFPFCNDPKLERRLHRISAPTLVLWGAEDRIVPVAHGERYASAIPDARLKILPETGHALLIEQPELGANAIFDFYAAA